MRSFLKDVRMVTAALAMPVLLLSATSPNVAFAETTSAASTSVALSEPVIRALQEALNKQGVAVAVNGLLNDETRIAIRKYQSQHHLGVSGDPDKATLDKLGVRQSSVSPQSSTIAQASPPPASNPPMQGQTPAPPPIQAQMQPGPMPGGMMNCPMMQTQMQSGQMQAMMQMMQGMMQMMQMMHGQMQTGPMQPGQMPGGPMQPKQN